MASFLLVAAGVVSLLVGMRGCMREKPPPEYKFPDIEINAFELAPIHSSNNPETPNDGEQGAVSYSPDVSVHLASKTADIDFTNPGNSQFCVTLSLYVDGQEAGTTGIIKPGYAVEIMDDLNTSFLSPGTYDGEFRVANYNMETGERAILSVTMPVSVSVS